jgi:hypothetical protein
MRHIPISSTLQVRKDNKTHSILATAQTYHAVPYLWWILIGNAKPWQQNHTHYRVPKGVPEGKASSDREESTKVFSNLVTLLNEGIKEKGGKAFDETKLITAFQEMVPPSSMKAGSAPVYAEKGTMLSVTDNAYVTWFAALDKVEKKAGVKVSFKRYLGRHTIKKPPVGTYPKLRERIDHIKLKVEDNWNPYV